MLATATVFVCLTGSAAARGDIIGFESPSGNIGCYMDKNHARCDIIEHDWVAPPKPDSCPLEYGHGLIVEKKGKGRYVCAGDSAHGGEKILGYGEAISRGRFRCKSKVSGMRCVNRRNGHGFKLSREVAKRF